MDVTKLESPGWPCVAAEAGWRGDVTSQPSACEVHAEFSLDGGEPTTAVFRRASAGERHWEWEAGSEARVPRDVLDGAAMRIGVHMRTVAPAEQPGAFAPCDQGAR